MRKFLLEGVIIIALYLLFICYLLFYSERIEQLNNSSEGNVNISINYGE